MRLALITRVSVSISRGQYSPTQNDIERPLRLVPSLGKGHGLAPKRVRLAALCLRNQKMIRFSVDKKPRLLRLEEGVAQTRICGCTQEATDLRILWLGDQNLLLCRAWGLQVMIA